MCRARAGQAFPHKWVKTDFFQEGSRTLLGHQTCFFFLPYPRLLFYKGLSTHYTRGENPPPAQSQCHFGMANHRHWALCFANWGYNAVFVCVSALFSR